MAGKKVQPDAAGRYKITAITQQVKTPGRYSVFVNETFAFALSEGGLLNSKVYVGQELSADDLAAHKDSAALDKAYGLTLRYVARRLRSEWELNEYFRRKDIDEETGRQILARLREYGYVDDRKFAESWVQNRRLLKDVSKLRLALELRQKHVPDEIIRQALEEDETSDVDTLRSLIAKKRQQSRYADQAKLMQYLARQGYRYDDIKRAMSSDED
jgi:regulatory protein